MRYASVCDGIGAVHVAWQPLGWECAWTSEIEPFPAEVVDHHWKLKNLGDMTALTEEMLDAAGPIQLLVGGTPCQSFSVAGLRKGLADPRGNLALRFTQLVGVLRPEWVVWENVPGVLSSEGGRDFGTFLGALAELGYGFAYRVLDAQWFGVAQRRRRVFVVANARDWRRAAAVLFERESLFGNPPTRDKTWQGVARSTASSLTGSGRGVERCGESRGQDDVVLWRGGDQRNSEVCRDHAGILNCNKGQHGGIVAFKENMSVPDATVGLCPTLQAENYHAVAFAQNQREEVRDLGDCSAALNVQGTHQQTFIATPYTKAKRAQSDQDDESWQPGDVAPTQSCFDQGDVRATTVVVNDCAASIGQRMRGQDDSCADNLQVMAFTTEQTPKFKEQCALTITKQSPTGGGQPQCVAYDLHGSEANKVASITDIHTPLRRRTPGGIENSCTTVVGVEDTTGTIRSNTRNNSSPQTECAMHVMHGMAVRRLTPVECERLQGFPDGYTDVTYRKKPAADGPRYKALGNSMAVPVMRWIGKRIAEQEATDGPNP